MKRIIILLSIILICLSAFAQTFKPDILGGKFEQATIVMPDDYEGNVVCTVIRSKANRHTGKAALYIHGFNDYFFQRELAEQFTGNGYNFYAVDLRKYGRSLLPHQNKCNIRKIEEYYADIDTAISIILKDRNNFIILCGHSTGGLTTSLYASEGSKRNTINALWLNSPFFDMNMNFILKRVGVPFFSVIGSLKPGISVATGNSELYGESLHVNYHGEWDYNLKWKLLKSPKMNFGWIHAIYQAQHRLRKGLKIICPILVMHSDKSIKADKWNDNIKHADIVLDIKDIIKHAPKIGKHVTIQSIENGKHDLTLSEKDVRKNVYYNLFKWLKNVI
ncbi:MAG: alpha/beta hydrolase [Prevotellaceae bacterium]|jgi:alpha-beta hydrolase superfamily lysophospholipase|nr:alpha/beta hydrolase [Prevotellaceae bacterium]